MDVWLPGHDDLAEDGPPAAAERPAMTAADSSTGESTASIDATGRASPPASPARRVSPAGWDERVDADTWVASFDLFMEGFPDLVLHACKTWLSTRTERFCVDGILEPD